MEKSNVNFKNVFSHAMESKFNCYVITPIIFLIYLYYHTYVSSSKPHLQFIIAMSVVFLLFLLVSYFRLRGGL